MKLEQAIMGFQGLGMICAGLTAAAGVMVILVRAPKKLSQHTESLMFPFLGGGNPFA